MGQEEIAKFLKTNPHKWFSCKDLSKELGVTESAISNSMKGVVKRELVDKKKFPEGRFGIYKYRYKQTKEQREEQDKNFFQRQYDKWTKGLE